MKNRALLVSILFSMLFYACTTNQTDKTANPIEGSKQDNNIVGIWKNIADEHTGIEFSADGNYYIINSNKRIIFDDSSRLLYELSTDENIENNFKLLSNNLQETSTGKLKFITPDKISISLLFKSGVKIEADYIRDAD